MENPQNQIKEKEVRVNSIVDSKLCNWLYILDAQIEKNFKFEDIATRPVNSNGLWCFTLIPAVLLSYTFLYNVTPMYKVMAFLSIGLLAYSVLFILFLYISCLILKGSYTSGCTFSIFVCTIPLYCILKLDLFSSLVLSALTIMPYSFVLKKALLNCPQTFTIGEAMIVSQAVALSFTYSVINILPTRYLPEMIVIEDDAEMILIKSYVITVLSTVGLLVTALWHLNEFDRNMKTLVRLVGSAAILALIELHLTVGRYCLLEFLTYLFRDKLRINLMLFWLGLVALATVVVLYRAEIGIKVTSATRKTFHILASLVFLTGILYDVHLIMLASGIVFGVMIFIEALRLSRIEPISSALQTAFNVYADEKDVGVFAVTPMYLYAGLACPLALVPAGAAGAGGCPLELLGGVLATGVGDTAASWVGERYGNNRWPGSTRTLEGTIANIGSQILTVYILNLFELLRCSNSLFRAAVAAAVSGLAEARLQQVDNLVLPLLTLAAFQLTAFLNYSC